MKKQFALTIATVLISIAAYCQGQDTDTYERRLIDEFEFASFGKQFTKVSKEIKGSPYINTSFLPAKIKNVNVNVLMRYNNFTDEFEFMDAKHDTLVLNKLEKFDNITFSGSQANYSLVNYASKGNMTLGYLIRVYEKKEFVLFKKQSIKYNKERIAKTSFDTNAPAEFARSGDTYYLKNNDKGVSEFPSNKKGLLKLFPEKKTELEAFLKQNDIDFDKEADLIKIINFLAV